MSQSLNEAGDEKTAEFERADSTFADMIARGRSYSGNERHCAFLNTNSEGNRGNVTRFANISATSGIDLPDDGRALVTVDWDHDGDLDVWVSNRNAPRLRFFRNDVPSDNHYLALRLQGTATTTSRDAIGARVEIILKADPSENSQPLPLIQTLRAGDSFLSQSSKWLHFGLGAADTIEGVRVGWPGGQTETFSNLEVDGRFLLVQGSGEAKRVAGRERTPALSDEPVVLPDVSATARIPLATLLPMAELSYRNFAGESQQLSIGNSRPLLINLWGSWCPSCLAELTEITEHEREIRAAGIEVVALAVDGLEKGAPEPDAPKHALKRMGFPFAAGSATREILGYLQTVHDWQMTGASALPLPVSFLIDEDDRISVIYKGRLKVAELLSDTRHSKGTLVERFARSAAVEGRTLPFVTVARQRNQFEARYRHATFLQQNGFTGMAAAENRALIAMYPEYAGPHNNLGIAYIRAKNLPLAEASFRKALTLQPDSVRAHANLGTLLVESGRLGEAAGHLQMAIKGNPRDKKSLAMLCQVLLDSKQWPDAQYYLERALKLDPRSANFHAHMGVALAQQGKLPQAVSSLEMALELQPKHADARKNLAIVQKLITQGE